MYEYFASRGMELAGEEKNKSLLEHSLSSAVSLKYFLKKLDKPEPREMCRLFTLALFFHSVEHVRVLVEAGAYLTDSLLLAAKGKYDSIEKIKYLVENGADTKGSGRWGECVVDHLKQRNDPSLNEIISKLENINN
jgi:hypothetical protein